jgi:hypothetical protein
VIALNMAPERVNLFKDSLFKASASVLGSLLGEEDREFLENCNGILIPDDIKSLFREEFEELVLWMIHESEDWMVISFKRCEELLVIGCSIS